MVIFPPHAFTGIRPVFHVFKYGIFVVAQQTEQRDSRTPYHMAHCPFKIRYLILIKYQPMKTYEGVDTALTFLTSALYDGEWSASRTSCLKTVPPYLMDRRLGGHQSRSGHYGEGKSLLPLPKVEPRYVGRPAFSLVIMPTHLSCLPLQLKCHLIHASSFIMRYVYRANKGLSMHINILIIVV
jgi:hypothetical protein